MHDLLQTKRAAVQICMRSVDHAAEGRRYLKSGLRLIKNGDTTGAAEAFFHAAVELEKAQDFRQIAALWEAIGKLSELQEGGTLHVSEKWPLDFHIMETDEWREQKDTMHKLAWVYQWAAEHRERAGDPHMAYPLFFRSARKAEQAEHCKNEPSWPAKLYHRAALNFISTYRTIERAPATHYIEKDVSDGELMKDAIRKFETYCLRIKDRSKGYGLLAIGYRSLKSKFIEVGNLAEAEHFRGNERSALMRQYFHGRSYLRAIGEWLSGTGFLYFVMGVVVIVLFVFPSVYYKWSLITHPQHIGYNVTYPDAIAYSIESALGVNHSELRAIGYGRLLNILEAGLSWIALALFVWWLTRRLE